jgi:hypothetical protein
MSTIEFLNRFSDYIFDIEPWAITEYGFYTALAIKLIADLDSGSIDQEFADELIKTYLHSRDVDLTDYM